MRELNFFSLLTVVMLVLFFLFLFLLINGWCYGDVFVALNPPSRAPLVLLSALSPFRLALSFFSSLRVLTIRLEMSSSREREGKTEWRRGEGSKQQSPSAFVAGRAGERALLSWLSLIGPLWARRRRCCVCVCVCSLVSFRFFLSFFLC